MRLFQLVSVVLAAQLGGGLACFINNCPHGGKRGSPAAVIQGQSLLPARPQFSDATRVGRPLLTADEATQKQQQYFPQQAVRKRLLSSLWPQLGGWGAQAEGPCQIRGVCSYPDCCRFEQCAHSEECQLLKKGFRVLAESILTKLSNIKPGAIDQGLIA